MYNYWLILGILVLAIVVAMYFNIKNKKDLLAELSQSKKALEIGERSLQAALLHGGLFYWEYYPQKAYPSVA